MSVRQNLPKARLSKSHFEVTVSHGNRRRSLALRPFTFYTLFGLVPFAGLVFLALSLYFVFHDDMLAALMSRETSQQYAYEDQLAVLRAEIVEMKSARTRDQSAYEDQISDLTSRQAKIEQRAVTIATLAGHAGGGGASAGQISVAQVQPAPDARRRAPPANALDTLLAIPGKQSLGAPATASAFAPITSPAPAPLPGGQSAPSAKPQPQAIELRSDNSDWMTSQAPQTPTAAPITERLGAVSYSLDAIETTQMGDIAAIGSAAQKSASKLRGALAEAGLETDRLKPPPGAKAQGGIGGPFIPLKPDAGNSPFDRAVLELQDNLLNADRLQHLLPYVPLRQPLAGSLQVTSPFGSRTDPFLGRPALHPGVDLRSPYGSPVQATAAGRVTIAKPDGGYGNLVEIDHGNGLATRYGHLSAILVTEGEEVTAGEVVGKLGSTGRSTGPHLHYEVRIDGEPVDPMRFLKAGEKLAASE